MSKVQPEGLLLWLLWLFLLLLNSFKEKKTLIGVGFTAERIWIANC